MLNSKIVYFRLEYLLMEIQNDPKTVAASYLDWFEYVKEGMLLFFRLFFKDLSAFIHQ